MLCRILYSKEGINVLHVIICSKTEIFDQSKLFALNTDSKHLTEDTALILLGTSYIVLGLSIFLKLGYLNLLSNGDHGR